MREDNGSQKTENRSDEDQNKSGDASVSPAGGYPEATEKVMEASDDHTEPYLQYRLGQQFEDEAQQIFHRSRGNVLSRNTKDESGPFQPWEESATVRRTAPSPLDFRMPL
ncbi:hypothetical protein [Occallatibacter savannae]|uniref:hypothetical protein n=1 Tax=Occallatibacter savannae TaxID=1002691 RepID=UPI0013A534BE|nr:hypothetical protein [Occallatibacter savannae]